LSLANIFHSLSELSLFVTVRFEVISCRRVSKWEKIDHKFK
jgi:hypothetical protein